MAREVILISALSDIQLLDKINEFLEKNHNRDPHCVGILKKDEPYEYFLAFIELDKYED